MAQGGKRVGRQHRLTERFKLSRRISQVSGLTRLAAEGGLIQ